MTAPSSTLADLTGKVCLVTGASRGIGRTAAEAFARMGAEVVMVCRDPGRGEEAAKEIRKATGNPKVEVLLADLTRLADVRRAAEQFLAGGRPLHVLLANAGLYKARRDLTPDGLEEQFAVNHFAHHLLVNLLLERLKASAPARVVVVSSAAHFSAGSRIRLDDFAWEKGFGLTGFQVYGQSKLANILFTCELARRLEGSGVTANCLHPGFVGTNFAKDNGALGRFAMALTSPFQRTPAEGSDTAIWLCASPEVEGVTGGYFFDRKQRRPGRAARSDDDARALWEVSDRVTGLASAAAAA
jgi:retinol dehydrogenase 12